MNIIFLAKYYFPHIGGVEKHLQELSRELINRGHQITIITLKHNSKLADFEIIEGVKVIRLPYSEKKLTIWKNLWQKRSLIKKADLIHCHDVFFWYLPFRFLYANLPVYTTFHGWEGQYPIPVKNIRARKISELLSWGNICIGDYLLKHYKTKTNYVLYGGSGYRAHGREQDIHSNKFKQIIYLGRLEEVNAIKEYLSALKKIKHTHNFKITFVGDGSYRQEASKIGTVTGMIKDVAAYLKKPAFVLASSYLSILEAMANQRPVFALYNNPLKTDYLKLFPGAGFIRLADSSRQLEKQFNQALKKPKKIDSMINQAFNFARQQTWAKVADKYLKLWQLK